MLHRAILEDILATLPALLVARANVNSNDACAMADNCVIALCLESPQRTWFYVRDRCRYRLAFDNATGALTCVQKLMQVTDRDNKPAHHWFHV